ncbi:MAG: 1-(5-phosphoribosyl)-5-[(5-phosphoribosylamino)methylideneamino]imidazole-4-carboxamide isomerase [Desulfobacterales bacterium]|nr:1-(5-phosphoribosyl)-5-[(5-phosphoribosylamino)methylideneamino]imidazole-4-carboxamide isomerase [Desulfobacterales bacterium]
MNVIPAIDIKNGRCVRLEQGRMDRETVFGDDPAAMARQWQSQGATLIHIVDLDGAVSKEPRNRSAIAAILAAVDVPLQLGGGIRDMATIEGYLKLGVQRIVIGTEAIRNPALVREAGRSFPDRMVVGIDARSGLVAIEGWTETTETTAVDLARRFEDCGVAAINFTDIHRDGMQTGPNIDETGKLAQAVSIPVVASGGVATLDDIRNLLPLETVGVVGVITGRALYSGTLELKAALAVARGHKP